MKEKKIVYESCGCGYESINGILITLVSACFLHDYSTSIYIDPIYQKRAK